MIQRIDALSNTTNATKFRQQQYQSAPSFEGLNVKKSAQTMKALAAAAILGMASVGMSSCTQPITPTPVEIPGEKAIDSRKNESALREAGFSHITSVSVPKEEGKYQPKKGEIVELAYKTAGSAQYISKLNRELSTDGHLFYDNIYYDWYCEEGEISKTNKMALDPENKTLTWGMVSKDDDSRTCPQYSYIKSNEDGTFTYGSFSVHPKTGGVVTMGKEYEYFLDNKDSYKGVDKKYSGLGDALWSDASYPEFYSKTDGKTTKYTNIEFKLAK